LLQEVCSFLSLYEQGRSSQGGPGRLHKFPCTNPAAKREKKPIHTHTHTHTKWSDSNKYCWPKDWVPRTSLHRHSPEWTNN
jgi:hypothetical protein